MILQIYFPISNLQNFIKQKIRPTTTCHNSLNLWRWSLMTHQHWSILLLKSSSPVAKNHQFMIDFLYWSIGKREFCPPGDVINLICEVTGGIPPNKHFGLDFSNMSAAAPRFHCFIYNSMLTKHIMCNLNV